MKKLLNITILTIVIFMSCSKPKINFSQIELVDLEQKGYKILLDSSIINLSSIYLNDDNVEGINQDKSNKTVNIHRKDKHISFISSSELLTQKKYISKIDYIVVNNLLIDSLNFAKIKFETGSIKYIRLLTQKDYEGKEFDDLPQIKKRIGNGMLIINTIESPVNID